MLPTRTNRKRHSEKKRKEGFESQTCWLRKQTEKPAAVDVSYIFMPGRDSWEVYTGSPWAEPGTGDSH